MIKIALVLARLHSNFVFVVRNEFTGDFNVNFQVALFDLGGQLGLVLPERGCCVAEEDGSCRHTEEAKRSKADKSLVHVFLRKINHALFRRLFSEEQAPVGYNVSFGQCC